MAEKKGLSVSAMPRSIKRPANTVPSLAGKCSMWRTYF